MTETLTEDQRNSVSELRLLLKNDIPPSMYNDTKCLLRFLIAREYHVKKAESMIRKNLRWKKEIQLEYLHTDFETPEVFKYFPLSFLGYDKEGAPIGYYHYEEMDIKGLSKCGNTNQLKKYSIKRYETDVKRAQNDTNGKCSRLIYIHNVYNTKVSPFLTKYNFRALLSLIMVFQDNYPETLKNVIVINAPATFATLWSLLKGWIGSSLLKKVLIYGEEGWKEELLERIDADVLPAFLGGNRTDPDGDPRCLTVVNRGGTVPEEYYREINTEEFLQNPGATSAKIGRQRQLTVPVEVCEPGCIINWEFIVLHSYDIGFGVSLNTSEDAFEELIPVHQVETERVPERGMYRCKATGAYSVIFDNSYSWIHSKEICYRIWTTSAD